MSSAKGLRDLGYAAAELLEAGFFLQDLRSYGEPLRGFILYMR